ncbi:hypothetical protein ACRXCV_15875 [Halobacteriovorax sp. GFR7]|uniref:hypothetical protein n=1 Tax=unclassified Halobacteriovorax TaxID=2639665 RepID=UPI003D99B897
MKNKMKLDHILIAVSDDEFETYKKSAQSNSSIKYKATFEKEWSWEACYVGLSNSLYLEIVKRSNYPNDVGLALSCLGEEEDLLSDLKQHYPKWNFEFEKAMKDGVHWYNGYFSKETESEVTFLWFMEYFSEFKSERVNLFSENVIDEVPVLYLSKNELEDLMSVVKNVPLEIDNVGSHVNFRDFEGRAFKVCISKSLDKRLFMGYAPPFRELNKLEK